MVIRGPHNAKIARIGFLIPDNSKITYCTILIDKYVEKLSFRRWHLAAILNMAIWGPQNAKPLAEMDSS